MDRAAWQAQREAQVEAEVGDRAARFERWSRPRRFMVALAWGLLASSLAIGFVALLWTRDSAGAAVMAVGFGVLLLGMVIWFTASPGYMLRAMSRSQKSSTDPAESPPWTIPG